MSEQEKQESQKTVVAFIAGLLIGGLLVWVFSDTPQPTPSDDSVEQAEESQDSENEPAEESSESTQDAEDTSSTPQASTPAPEVPVLQTGEGEVVVSNQPADTAVVLDSATFPTDEGWIGVRDYVNGQLTGILGVARFSKEQGLVPESVPLQRATEAGMTYAIVFFNESGDREFKVADDSQIEGIFGTFTAQ